MGSERYQKGVRVISNRGQTGGREREMRDLRRIRERLKKGQ